MKLNLPTQRNAKNRQSLSPEQLFSQKLALAFDRLEEAHNARAIELRAPRIIDGLLREAPSPLMIEEAKQQFHQEGYGQFLPS